jgi:hypothetical protein
MKLHEIISMLDQPTTSVLIERLVPYKKSLCIYYTRYFSCEPILMVVMVANAVQYAQIVPSNEFSDAVFHWVESMDLEEEDKEGAIETISSNSILLEKL